MRTGEVVEGVEQDGTRYRAEFGARAITVTVQKDDLMIAASYLLTREPRFGYDVDDIEGADWLTETLEEELTRQHRAAHGS